MSAGYSNFRRSFNGFNRHDVISYIEKLAAERNSYQAETDKLREQIVLLEEKIENNEADTERMLSERTKELEQQLEEKRSRSNEALAEEIRTAESVISELRKEYNQLYSDMELNLSHGKCELERASGNLTAISGVFASVAERLAEIEHSITNLKDGLQQ